MRYIEIKEGLIDYDGYLIYPVWFNKKIDIGFYKKVKKKKL